MAENMKIYEAIPKVMADINPVGKDKVNNQQKFKYRGVDDVMNAINPALVKHKVFVVPEILEQIREDRVTNNGAKLIYSICKIRYRFCAEDGSYVEAVTIGEGMDSGDKATNKAMAIAFKYACFQVFCIPTEEMKDPDAECHNVVAGDNKQTADVNNLRITPVDINTLKTRMYKCGVPDKTVLDRYKVARFEDMTFAQFQNAMGILSNMPEEK